MSRFAPPLLSKAPQMSGETIPSGGLRGVRRWLLFNLATLVLYVGLEIWVLLPRIRSEAFDPIEIFVFWCTRLLPILFVAWVANVVWAVRIAKGPQEQRNRKFAWWLAVFLVWCAVLAYKSGGVLLRIL